MTRSAAPGVAEESARPTGSPPTDLWSLVEAQSALRPDGVLAVDERDRVLTFADFRMRAERVAAGLTALGVGEGTPVSWQLPTRIESIVLVGALARLGAVQNPCLPIYRERELRYVLRAFRPRLFVVPGVWRGVDYTAMAHAVVDEATRDDPFPCRVVVADPDLPEGDPANLPPPIPVAAPGEEPIRWVFFTSGTTADPKGARHTDATIACGGAAVAERFAMTDADRYPIVFPFTHIGGIGMLMAQLMTGAGAIAVEQYDPERSPDLFARHHLTIGAGGTPVALLYLQAQRRRPDRRLLPELRVVMAGAAPKPPTLDAELRDELGGIGSVSVYGLTEVPFATAGSVDDPAEWRASTEGRAVPGAELRIVDAQGQPVPDGVTGEICVRGSIVCRGYLDERRNAEAFDADGFFHTGDLGSVDEHGNLTVTGRLKDVIIRKGENISAKEVEDVLYTHPDVADVAVIGLPDAQSGERACAVVVLREGAPHLALTAVGQHCRAAGLAPQKIPERIEILDSLPRNASGKILKYRLQEIYT